MFVFAHIGRAAGTTFRYVLRRNFRDRLLPIHSHLIKEHFGADRITPRTNKLTDEELTQILNCYPGIECISGHFFCFPNRFDNFKVMTILRDPVERVVSHYLSFRRKYLDLNVDEFPDHMKYDFRYDINLFFKHCDYVSSKYGVANSCVNGQTWSLDSNMNLDQAINRLKNDFFFVGLVEKFDEGLLILSEQFRELGRSFDIMYETQDVASSVVDGVRYMSQRKAVKIQKKAKETLITDNIRKKIKEMNQMDYILYEEAKKLFNERLSQYQGDVKADLYNYRRQLRQWKLKNRLYGPLKVSQVKSSINWLKGKISGN
tara:strand:+ start:5174 stop:6124 length:951 start_codon:yes stop_codon:yes gene_type:complete